MNTITMLQLDLLKVISRNRLIASYLNSKGGLFANAQGLEAVIDETTPHDESFRDIQRPYHKVSHIKISNNTRWVMDNFLLKQIWVSAQF
jgi:iron complex outermembrane receptor protein